mmetsp:Transcript_50381/g.148724  ORF Transcript_50381/g.148724 Transcript_50381/m.148724 type:complete len:273 (-) Transcript_50381:28-846(-)
MHEVACSMAALVGPLASMRMRSLQMPALMSPSLYSGSALNASDLSARAASVRLAQSDDCSPSMYCHVSCRLSTVSFFFPPLSDAAAGAGSRLSACSFGVSPVSNSTSSASASSSSSSSAAVSCACGTPSPAKRSSFTRPTCAGGAGGAALAPNVGSSCERSIVGATGCAASGCGTMNGLSVSGCCVYGCEYGIGWPIGCGKACWPIGCIGGWPIGCWPIGCCCPGEAPPIAGNGLSCPGNAPGCWKPGTICCWPAGCPNDANGSCCISACAQ